MTLGRAVSIDCQVVVLNEQLCSQMFALHCVGSGSSAATILSFHNYGPSFVPLGSVGGGVRGFNYWWGFSRNLFIPSITTQSNSNY